MPNIECTICPSYLRCPSGMTAQDIKSMVNLLQNIFLILDDNGIDYFIFASAFDEYEFPWSTIKNNAALRSPLMDLWNSIYPRIRSGYDCETVVNIYCQGCNLPDSNWCGDLKEWDSSCCSSKCIFVAQSCNNKEIEKIQTIKDGSNLNGIIFPWLMFSDTRLPTSGDYPYLPPVHWESRGCLSESHDGQYGYIDKNGDFWVWDKMHDDHWDVINLKTKNHKRVTSKGKILKG